MTNTIFYFSGTGNSLNVARILAEKLGDTDIVPISTAIREDTIEVNSDTVGFVFPLYLMGLPKIVFDFIKKMEFENVNYFFTVVTRGGSPGGAMHQINRLLKKKSKKLNAGFYLTLFSNFIAYYELPTEAERSELLQEGEKKVIEIAAILKERKNQVDHERFSFVFRTLNKGLRKAVNKRDKKFSVDETCNSCGICQKVCSVGNIEIVNEKPEWQHKCQLCLACLHFCPQEAIQNGKKTAGRERYHHPNTKMKDFILSD